MVLCCNVTADRTIVDTGLVVSSVTIPDNIQYKYELCDEKPCTADQHLCFRYIDSSIPLFPKSKVQAFSHLQWLYIPVCVGPGWKS